MSDNIDTTNRSLPLAATPLFGLRPCLAEGSPALFHRWMENMQCAVGDGSELYKRTTALVELPDGSMDSVDPYRIQFTDRPNK
jgi:hypothetical protein